MSYTTTMGLMGMIFAAAVVIDATREHDAIARVLFMAALFIAYLAGTKENEEEEREG